MSETPPDKQIERDAAELDERLSKLDDRIGEAQGKLHAATDAEPGKGPDAAGFPAGFDDEPDANAPGAQL